MDAAVLVLMVLSIIAYLIAILIAVRVPVVRRIERRSPWLIVVLILGFLLLNVSLLWLRSLSVLLQGTRASQCATCRWK